MKAELDKKIDSHFNSDNQSNQNKAAKSKSAQCICKPSDQEMSDLFSKLNECKNKPVIPSLVSPYADRFILKSWGILTLFDPENLKLNYVDLLTKCSEIDILSDSEIEIIEQDTREQSRTSAFLPTELVELERPKVIPFSIQMQHSHQYH